MKMKPSEIREYAQAIKEHAPRGHRTAQEVTDALADMTLQLLDEREKLIDALGQSEKELSQWNHWATTTRPGYQGSSGWQMTCSAIFAARAFLTR